MSLRLMFIFYHHNHFGGAINQWILQSSDINSKQTPNWIGPHIKAHKLNKTYLIIKKHQGSHIRLTTNSNRITKIPLTSGKPNKILMTSLIVTDTYSRVCLILSFQRGYFFLWPHNGCTINLGLYNPVDCCILIPRIWVFNVRLQFSSLLNIIRVFFVLD